MQKILLASLLMLLMPPTFAQSKSKGYFNSTQISLLMGNRQSTEMIPYYPHYLSSSILYPPYYYYEPRTQMKSYPSVTTTHGYMFNHQWAVGMGVGFELFDRNLFPLFADIRYTPWEQFSPLFAIKMGYAFSSFNKKNKELTNYGGIMVQPETGITILSNHRSSLILTVAYRFQKTQSIQRYEEGSYFEQWKHDESLHRLSFGIAVMFR